MTYRHAHVKYTASAWCDIYRRADLNRHTCAVLCLSRLVVTHDARCADDRRRNTVRYPYALTPRHSCLRSTSISIIESLLIVIVVVRALRGTRFPILIKTQHRVAAVLDERSRSAIVEICFPLFRALTRTGRCRYSRGRPGILSRVTMSARLGNAGFVSADVIKTRVVEGRALDTVGLGSRNTAPRRLRDPVAGR